MLLLHLLSLIVFLFLLRLFTALFGYFNYCTFQSNMLKCYCTRGEDCVNNTCIAIAEVGGVKGQCQAVFAEEQHDTKPYYTCDDGAGHRIPDLSKFRCFLYACRLIYFILKNTQIARHPSTCLLTLQGVTPLIHTVFLP